MTISGTGCALMDYLYADIRLGSPAFSRYRSRAPGDGGLEPGKLVFVEDLERFAAARGAAETSSTEAATPFDSILRELSGGRAPDRANLGGPSIVSLIHAAQLLAGSDVRVRYFGARGSDHGGDDLARVAGGTPIDMAGYVELEGSTPFTCVFSDPTFDQGHGERTFVNDLGVAARFGPEHLPPRFFEAEIAAFGGTALVPRIHESLGALCAQAKRGGSIVVVNTVFDFRSEARRASRWPLGSSDETYRHIDLLVMDREEALRLSGARDTGAALEFFKAEGAGAAIVTDGARDIRFYSRGGLFAPIETGRLPVSAEVARVLRSAERPPGDTTGCGDNFVGGMLKAVAAQLEAGAARGMLDMEEACSEAVVAGGFACFYIGGTYFEKEPGEKRRRIEALTKLYRAQRAGSSLPR